MKSNRINDVTDSVLDESVKYLYQPVLSSLSRSGRSFNVYHATSGADPNERGGGHHTIDLSLKKNKKNSRLKKNTHVIWGEGGPLVLSRNLRMDRPSFRLNPKSVTGYII